MQRFSMLGEREESDQRLQMGDVLKKLTPLGQVLKEVLIFQHTLYKIEDGLRG